MIPDEDKEDLDRPFSSIEISLDGYTAKFYKTFLDPLLPFLTRLNDISPSCPFFTRTLEAHIALIPKPDKDYTQCGNYSSISLLGNDIKLYAKVIANRPATTLHSHGSSGLCLGPGITLLKHSS